MWLHLELTTTYGGFVITVDPTTLVLTVLTAFNGLGLIFLAVRGRDAVLRRTSDAAYAISCEVKLAHDQLETQRGGDRLEHIRQVEELTNLVADISRTRQSADAAVSRRERKQRGPPEDVAPPQDPREASISQARRHFAAVG